jgi:hypothetical protein
VYASDAGWASGTVNVSETVRVYALGAATESEWRMRREWRRRRRRPKRSMQYFSISTRETRRSDRHHIACIDYDRRIVRRTRNEKQTMMDKVDSERAEIVLIHKHIEMSVRRQIYIKDLDHKTGG